MIATHPGRIRRAQRIDQLVADDDWDTAYRQIALYDFAAETRMALQLAFMRPPAVPHMAAILAAAGKMTRDPLKRAYDTGIVMHELYYRGLNHPDSRHWLRRLNRSHHGRGITADDMAYVLAIFMVVPTRYINRVGWRPLTDNETLATVRWYQRLGQLIHVDHIPTSYTEATQLVDQYEADHVAPSADGAKLGRTTLDVLRVRMPRPLQPLAEPIFTANLAASQHDPTDRNLADALGLQPPSGTGHAVFPVIANARRQALRQLPPRRQPNFTPGQKTRAYPSGYSTADFPV